MRIELKGVRLQQWGGQLWTAKGYKGGDPNYQLHAIFPKDHKDRFTGQKTIDIIEAAMVDAAKELFGSKWEATLKAAKLADRVPIHDGDSKPESDGYPGNYFVMAKSRGGKPAPTVLHRLKDPETGGQWKVKQSDGIVYDGCYVDVIMDIYAYDEPQNGITAGLKGLRFVKDGDAFGNGAPINADAFSELPSDDIEL